jgi:hypothetical protein
MPSLSRALHRGQTTVKWSELRPPRDANAPTVDELFG